MRREEWVVKVSQVTLVSVDQMVSQVMQDNLELPVILDKMGLMGNREETVKGVYRVNTVNLVNLE